MACPFFIYSAEVAVSGATDINTRTPVKVVVDSYDYIKKQLSRYWLNYLVFSSLIYPD
jgi:hypothetical protein